MFIPDRPLKYLNIGEPLKYLIFIAVAFQFACATGPKPPKYSREYTPVDSKTFGFEDKTIKLTYSPITFGSGIPVIIENKTNTPLKIIWDESTFIESDGTASKIIHAGVRLMEKNSPMAPTLVPPKAKVVDSVTPTNRIYYSKGWDSLNICGREGYVSLTTLSQDDESCLGKTFGFYLTYEIDGKKIGVTQKFTFSKREIIPPTTVGSTEKP
jgi:hypothetical protein